MSKLLTGLFHLQAKVFDTSVRAREVVFARDPTSLARDNINARIYIGYCERGHKHCSIPGCYQLQDSESSPLFGLKWKNTYLEGGVRHRKYLN